MNHLFELFSYEFHPRKMSPPNGLVVGDVFQLKKRESWSLEDPTTRSSKTAPGPKKALGEELSQIQPKIKRFGTQIIH